MKVDYLLNNVDKNERIALNPIPQPDFLFLELAPNMYF